MWDIWKSLFWCRKKGLSNSVSSSQCWIFSMFSIVRLQCVLECPRWENRKCGRRGTSTSSRKWEVDSYDDKATEKEVRHEVTQNIFSGFLHADVRGFARSWKQSRYYASYAHTSTHLCGALLSSCVAIVHHALKKTSQEYLIACLRARALMATLSYPGFFSTGSSEWSHLLLQICVRNFFLL